MNYQNKACDMAYYSPIYKFDLFIGHSSSDILIEFGCNFVALDCKIFY